VRVAALVFLAGCDLVFSLDRPNDAATDDGTCAPLPFDPIRYFPGGASIIGHSWDEARNDCRLGGYDLAVLDVGDPELGHPETTGNVPFWYGISFGTDDWTAIDGCAPELTWAGGQPLPETPGQCVVQTAEGMSAAGCQNQTLASVAVTGVCEAKRPSAACRAAAGVRNYLPMPGLNVTQSDATVACSNAGMHLVEINSSDELDFVRTQIAATIPTFWIGATLFGSGTTADWRSPTGCPQVFQWDVFPSGVDNCARVTPTGMEAVGCVTLAGVICEG